MDNLIQKYHGVYSGTDPLKDAKRMRKEYVHRKCKEIKMKLEEGNLDKMGGKINSKLNQDVFDVFGHGV